VGGTDKNKTAVEKPKESAETTPGEEEKVRQVIEVRFGANINRVKPITITYNTFYAIGIFSRYMKVDTTCLWNNF